MFEEGLRGLQSGNVGIAMSLAVGGFVRLMKRIHRDSASFLH